MDKDCSRTDGWTRRWKTWLKPTKIPNVWLRKEGGHLVRARIKDPTTGRQKEIKKVLPQADAAAAFNWLASERKRIQAGFIQAPRQSVHFGDYAVSLYEKKAAPGGKIKSSAGRMRWRSTLQHLIQGTNGATTGTTVPGFGEIYVDKLHARHVEAWKAGIGQLIAAGDYAPTTANGWLSILRVIMHAAAREFDLAHRALDGIEDFDTSEHATYTEEEPNSLPAERVGEFLRHLRELHPQHYAMTYLGFITGLRPSSLRPLRRTGPSADVVWDKQRLLVRRSQTRGDEVMNTTKNKKRYAIDLPEEAMQVLRWHVDTQLTTPEQQASDLLFPSITGGFRAPNVLNKPFAEIAAGMELGYPFTQRGMRRTFNDLARHANIVPIVTRSISGHLTERMQDHYSTVQADEQRQSIGKVIDLFSRHTNKASRTGTADSQGEATGAPSAPSGALSGAPPAASGAPGQ